MPQHFARLKQSSGQGPKLLVHEAARQPRRSSAAPLARSKNRSPKNRSPKNRSSAAPLAQKTARTAMGFL